MRGMDGKPFTATGKSFSVHEWRGSGPAKLHLHHSDDEAWHVLEGELQFRYADRSETIGAGGAISDCAHAAFELVNRGAPVGAGCEPACGDLPAV